MNEEVDDAITIIWQIENIKSYNIDVHSSYVHSPPFVLNNLYDTEWRLSFFKEDTQGDFNVFLTLIGNKENVSFNCKWFLLDDNRNTLLTRVTQCHSALSLQIVPMFDQSTSGSFTFNRSSIFLADDKLIVKLVIYATEGSFEQSEYFSIVTRFLDKSPHKFFVWSIENFFSFCTFQLENEALATVCCNDNVFRLRLFLMGKSFNDANLNFGITTENDNLKSLKVKISFNNHKEFIEKKHTYNPTKSKQTWVVSKLVSIPEILKSPSNWLCCDDLMFICKLEYDLRSYIHSYIDRSHRGPLQFYRPVLKNFESGKVGKQIKQYPDFIVSSIWNEEVQTSLFGEDSLDERSVSMKAMEEDFYSAYSEGNLCDFKLLAGGTPFLVHKAALCARSRFFRALLDWDSTTLQVPDLDKDTLKQMIAFIYSGILPDLKWGTAVLLYEAADKYELPSLKPECSKALRSNIAISNFCDFLELADRHHDQELTASVIEFIEDNFDDVIFSTEWARFLDRSYLAGKIMIGICKRRNDAIPSLCGRS